MYPTEDENKHRKLIDDLKNLKKIEAPVGFESKLWNKINAKDSQESRSVWNKISVRLVPAVAVLATAAILFVIIDNNASEFQDPFMIEPEERKDLIEFSTSDLDLAEPKVKIAEEQVKQKSSVRFRKKEIQSEEFSAEPPMAGRDQVLESNDSLIPQELQVGASYSVRNEVVRDDTLIAPEASMRQGLNFRQVQLTKEEKQTVNDLKDEILKEKSKKTE